MSIFKRLFEYIKPFIPLLIFTALLTIVISALRIGSIGALVGTLKVIFASPENIGKIKYFNFIKSLDIPHKEKIIPYIHHIQKVFANKPFALLKTVLIIFLIANITRSFLVFLRNFINVYVGTKVVEKFRNALYNKCLEMDFYFYSKYKSGDLFSRILNDTGRIQTTISKDLVRFLSSPIDIFVKIIALFFIDAKISFFIFVLFPLIGGPIIYFGRKIKKVAKKAQKKTADISSIVKEVLMGINIVQAFNMIDYEKEKFQKEHRKLINLRIKNAFISAISGPTVETIIGFVIVFLVLWGGYVIIVQRSMPAEKFILYLATMRELYSPVKDLIRANNNIQSGLASAERVFEILDEKNIIKEYAKPIILKKVKKGIEFKNVSFAYTRNKFVLKDINLLIPANKCIALVGPSGAGKTTLTQLIPRFIEPTEGIILIDDIDYRKYSLKSLREQIGIVTQNIFLFDDTIYNNIAYGHKDLPMEKVIEAAKKANAHDFIIKLPQGYDTPIGELGNSLSGGQRQRISIARAILKNPSILLLDEATSSLDSESEALVQKALETLMKDKTTIIIAHRLSTVVNADEIIFLRDGKITERGTHQELLSKKGEYAKFFKTQILSHKT